MGRTKGERKGIDPEEAKKSNQKDVRLAAKKRRVQPNVWHRARGPWGVGQTARKVGQRGLAGGVARE